MGEPGLALLVDKDGHSALFVAAHVRRIDVVRLLLDTTEAKRMPDEQIERMKVNKSDMRRAPTSRARLPWLN